MTPKTTEVKDWPFISLGTGKHWFSLYTSCIVCGCVYVNICIYIWILLIITVSSADTEDFNARPEGLVAHRNIYTEMFLKYGILFDLPAMIVSCISMMIGVRINHHGLMFPFLIVMFPHVVLIQLFSFYNHEQFDIYIFGVWLFQGAEIIFWSLCLTTYKFMPLKKIYKWKYMKMRQNRTHPGVSSPFWGLQHRTLFK